MLQLEHVSVFYGSFQVMWGVSFAVADGVTACVLGPNGAGKSTVLKAIAGLVPIRGRISYRGEEISAWSPARRVGAGIGLVLERRRLFADMSVLENLLIGGYRLAGARRRVRLSEVTDLLPGLASLIRRRAGDLSGGQQQLVAIGRGLMAEPTLLMLDEPFLGLSPKAVDEVEGIIAALGRGGPTILFNEQNVRRSLAMSQQSFLLEGGRLITQGASSDVAAGDMVQKVYFGTPRPHEAAS